MPLVLFLAGVAGFCEGFQCLLVGPFGEQLSCAMWVQRLAVMTDDLSLNPARVTNRNPSVAHLHPDMAS